MNPDYKAGDIILYQEDEEPHQIMGISPVNDRYYVLRSLKTGVSWVWNILDVDSDSKRVPDGNDILKGLL